MARRSKKSKNRMPQELREAVYERAQYMCEVMEPGTCEGVAGHVHHRRMRSQGGEHTLVNCVAVCPSCHRFIHANPSKSYSLGWLVRSTREPESMPFFRRGGAVILMPDGEMERSAD